MNVLFTRLQNIGDMLVCIPALRVLREKLPEAHITVLAKHAGGVEIIRSCPYVNEILVIRDRSIREKLRVLGALRQRRYEYAIISPQDLGRVPLLWLGGARRIIGYPRVYQYGRWQREKLAWLLYRAPHHDTLRTEVELCVRLVLDVLEDCGAAPVVMPSLALEYSWVARRDVERAEELLRGCGIGPGGAFVAIAAYSKRPAKNWPAARWVELLRRIGSVWRVPVVLLGGVAEAEGLRELGEAAGGEVAVLAGATSLAECAAVLRRARMFVGPDSGPAFLATAVGTPAVVLYGPADYYRWRVPESAAARVEIFHPVSCTPCRHQICPLAEPCMAQIGVEEVWAACEQVWRDSGR
ncbi:MAG: glycosyltransferase family 9 protein [bacterium]|nr:glycosyltransferase family 9 protein [bacterium]